MSFEERPFLILFGVAYALWLLARRREPHAVALLLTASLLFYGHKHWKLLPLLVAFCVADWTVALRIAASARPKRWLALGVGFNLGVLALFKYAPLVAGTAFDLTGVRLLSERTLEAWAIPFGISFYSFTGVAYLVDVYRRTTTPEPNVWRYTLSATFFPHLVAGPILRADEFLDRLRPGRLPTHAAAPLEAAGLIARGYFKKLVLAHRLAEAIDPFFLFVRHPVTDGFWALPYVWLYALQIYFDFSAYTDLARGFGLLFGYRWPENFHRPYLAASVAEFWRRWHVTLSRFLRDYLYVPLGGNRGGPLRTGFNLMATMTLGGLWHGASWSFLVWGALHGTFLIAHRLWAATRLRALLARRGGMAWRACCVALTFHAVCLAWCFFRLTAFADAAACVRKWVAFDPAKVWTGPLVDGSLWAVLLGYAAVSGMMGRLDARDLRWPAAVGCRWGLRVALVLLALLLSPGTPAPPFIYFQF